MSISINSIPEQKKVHGKDFPLVVHPDTPQLESSKDDFLSWIDNNQTQLHQMLIEHGAILFRGFPVDSSKDFEDMLNQTAYTNMPYVGGAAPRTKVSQNRVVTANESPSSEKIPFHHEMAQVPKPPGYIFFFCDQASETGGATSILHSSEICQNFFEIDSDYATALEKEGVRYIRVMPEQTDTSSAIGRSWKETFQVEDRSSAEKRMQELGTTWRWEEGGDLYTETATLPAIRFDEETKQKVFFNSIIAAYTGWNDSRNKGETAVVRGSGGFLDHQIMNRTIEKMDELAVNFKWQKGDVLWVNNHTVMHARQPFTGDRLILASIAIK